MTSMVRTAPALLVARALARSWLYRPIRLVVAIAGGISGVLLTTAVLLIATPVLNSTRLPPVEGIAPNITAVVARAPAGMSPGLVNRVIQGSNPAAASRVVVANTTIRDGHHNFVPVIVLGVDLLLESMLEADAASGAPPVGPNEAYLQRTWANEHDLHAGDRLEVTTPSGVTTWKVKGLLHTVFANNGSSIVVPTATAAKAFDRGSNVNLLLLRPNGNPQSMRERAAALVDGAADVVAPNQVFASYARIYRTPLMLVAMLGAIAVLVGCVVLFLTWRLALIDARPILSRLRLLGVRTSDLFLGSGLVLIPVLIASYVVGAVAGCVIGSSLSSFRDQILNFTGQAFNPPLNLILPLVGGFVASLFMFGFAWLTGVQQLRRSTAIEAILGRDVAMFERSRVLLPIGIGCGCFVLADMLIILTSGVLRASATVPLLIGVAVLSAALPVVAGTVIRVASKGAGGLLVGRQLQVEWRRNAALATTFAITLFCSIATSGIAGSTLTAINQSNARWTKGQMYVTSAPLGHNYESETFPAAIQREIAAIPGVRSTDTFSYVDAEVRGGRHLLEMDGGDAVGLTAPRLTAGPTAVVSKAESLFSILTGDDIAISSNFARTQHLNVGSTIEIPVSDGHRTGRVVAVIDDSISDGGMVMVGPQLFQEVAGPSRVFYVGVGLARGTHEQAVRQHIQSLVGHRYPRAQVLSVGRYRAAVSSLLGRLMSSFAIFAWVMFAVAAVVGTATLASSIAERSRAAALTRLVGGRRRAIRNLFGIEAIVTVTIAWLIAVLGAQLAIPALIAGQSVFSGLLPHVQVPLTMMGLSMPMAILATGVALIIARRTVSEVPIARLIADE